MNIFKSFYIVQRPWKKRIYSSYDSSQKKDEERKKNRKREMVKLPGFNLCAMLPQALLVLAVWIYYDVTRLKQRIKNPHPFLFKLHGSFNSADIDYSYREINRNLHIYIYNFRSAFHSIYSKVASSLFICQIDIYTYFLLSLVFYIDMIYRFLSSFISQPYIFFFVDRKSFRNLMIISL